MDNWHQFDTLDRRRRMQRRLHEEAFRRLEIGASDAGAVRAWEAYCEAARSLESCVAELESAVWKLDR